MPNLELSFAAGEFPLSIRSFSVDQRLSGLFEIGVVAVSPDDDLDLDAILGSGAVLRLGSTDEGAVFRAWSGIVCQAEQVEIDAAHVATYYLRLVPALWRATRRRNNRIFQHQSIPDIAAALLAEWGIEPAIALDRASFPRFEYRVQYGESDFHFLSRLLEEAGVAYTFRDPDAGAEGAQSALVLATDLHADEAQPPLVYVPGKDIKFPPRSAWQVRFTEDVRSGRRTLRDYDFRSRPDFQLIAEARAQSPLEDRFELYDYAPGAFIVEPDGGRAARVDERHAQALVDRRLGAERTGKRSLAYRTNALDLAPGLVFTLAGHPRRELADGRRLLAVQQTIEGEADGEWVVRGHAVTADEPFRPALATPCPRIPGVQSALVVGPPGEEIHTDEYGRVRVQFHWDREGKRDQSASCFVRVSQAWAGRGFGVTALPRVGDEVLVGFFEGDPDQPVIVGRVHNSAARVPLSLPAQKTRSTWRTESTPGGGGWNEITFEDQKGKELVYVQAERDMERLVKQHETVTIGASLTTSIGAAESREVAADQTISVSGNRTSQVGGSETIQVGQSFKLDLGGGAAGLSVTSDKRIVFTTGEASIVLDGPNILLDGKAAIRVSGGEVVAIGGGEVHVDGGPNVFLNAGSASAPGPAKMASASEDQAPAEAPETPEEKAFSALLSAPPEEPGAAPEAVTLPAHVEEQLKAARDKALHTVDAIEAKVLDKVDMVKAKLKELGEDLVPRVEKARAEINARIEALRGQIEKVKAEAAARINALKAEAERLWAQVQARVDMAKAMVDRVKQAVNDVRERIEEAKTRVRQTIADIKQRITDLRDNVKTRFDDLRKRAIAVRDEAKNVIDEVKGAIDHAKEQAKQLVTDVKTTIDHAKQHFHDIVADLKNHNVSLKQRIQDAFGDAQEMWADGQADVGKVSAGANALVNDAKASAKQIAADAKQTAADAKQLGKDAVKDAKDSIDEAKKAAQDSVDEVKATAQDLKDQAKGATQDVKDAWGDLKGQAKDLFGKGSNPAKAAGDAASQASAGSPVPFAKQGLPGTPNLGSAPSLSLPGGQAPSLPGTPNLGAGIPGAANQASVGSPVAFAKHGLPGTPDLGSAPSLSLPGGSPPAPSSTILTKGGALGAGDVSQAVNGTSGATFLQSPNEGQLMVLPTQVAKPIAPEVIRAQVVNHQMGGMTSSDAVAAVLQDHGYAVYERPWDAVMGQFIQKAVL